MWGAPPHPRPRSCSRKEVTEFIITLLYLTSISLIVVLGGLPGGGILPYFQSPGGVQGVLAGPRMGGLDEHLVA